MSHEQRRCNPSPMDIPLKMCREMDIKGKKVTPDFTLRFLITSSEWLYPLHHPVNEPNFIDIYSIILFLQQTR